jgi:GxxExxY protein
MELTKVYLKDLVYKVNGAAIKIHKALGPGLLESVYHKCMVHELTYRNISFKTELPVLIKYDGLEIDSGLRCDLLVENSLVVEFKAVEKILPIHIAQLMTYMKLLNLPMGLIINFNCIHIFTHGQKTIVNELYNYLY